MHSLCMLEMVLDILSVSYFLDSPGSDTVHKKHDLTCRRLGIQMLVASDLSCLYK